MYFQSLDCNFSELFCSAFTCLCYSADGKTILAAGQSPYVCVYSAVDQILLKRFKITQNQSMDGVMVGTHSSQLLGAPLIYTRCTGIIYS